MKCKSKSSRCLAQISMLPCEFRAHALASFCVLQRFEQFNNNVPDFNAYLVYVLVSPLPNVNAASRSVAGYMLVNNMRRAFLAIDASVIDYIKQTIFTGLQDPESDVRRATSAALTWLIRGVMPDTWPEGLTKLAELMNSPSDDVQEVGSIC